MATVLARPRLEAFVERATAALWALGLVVVAMALLAVTVVRLVDPAPVSTVALVAVPLAALVTLFAGSPGAWVGRRTLELRRTRDLARTMSAGTLLLTIPLAAITFAVPSGPDVVRAAGADRVGTAVALSETAFDSADAVVLTGADALADAVVAAPLAGSVGGPLLLTGSGHLPEAVTDEILRLGATTVYLVGEGLPQDGLRGAGVTRIERISGLDAAATAAAIAERVGGDHAYLIQGQGLAAGEGWPDAVSVAALAAWQGEPVLLADGDALPEATLAAITELGVESVTLVGGEAVVPPAVGEVLEAVGLSVDRIAGDDRYGTSAAVAARARTEGATGDRAWVATGADWPDALAAGPAVAHGGDVLVLLPPAHGHDAETRGWLDDNWTRFDEVVLIGGERVLPESALTGIGTRWR